MTDMSVSVSAKNANAPTTTWWRAGARWVFRASPPAISVFEDWAPGTPVE
jgi:hypothetical protein